MAKQAEKKAAIYARVSTVGKGQSTDMQVSEVQEYIKARGWTVAPEHIYLEAGISGAKAKRPQLDKLMADAGRGRFNIVIVYKFDRFARSVSHLLRALEHFQSLNIDFISIHEQIDTSTPVGKMVYTVLAAVAELERSLIIERVRSGIAHARKKGTVLGRREVLVDRESVSKMRDDGVSIRGMARALGISAAKVQRVLSILGPATKGGGRPGAHGGDAVGALDKAARRSMSRRGRRAVGDMEAVPVIEAGAALPPVFDESDD